MQATQKIRRQHTHQVAFVSVRDGSDHGPGGASFFEGRFGRGWGSCNDLAVGDSAPESSSEVRDSQACVDLIDTVGGGTDCNQKPT